jgi:SAM-dependent methyltransferase
MNERAAEGFKPIPVSFGSPLKFRLRCLLDLQLLTISRALQPALEDLPSGTVIDVGAGQSPWRQWIRCGYVGVDVENASDFGMHSKDLVLYDGTTLPFQDETFDSALCVEVLEHASDPEMLLSEVCRVLKKGAPFLLTVPWSARRHHIPFDFHRFTKERLQVMLCESGFVNVSVEERGDDVSVIANKLIVLTLRLLSPRSFKGLVSIPIGMLCSVVTAGMLFAAHLSIAFGLGSKDDPLGYFCRAMKA